MKVLRCQDEDLPGHIAAIERYTHLFKVEIAESGIRDKIIQHTKNYYNNSNIIPTKLIDDNGNILQYVSFYRAMTVPTTLLRGGFLSDYGNEHYTSMDLMTEYLFHMYLDFAMTDKTTEILVYQRMARARFTNKVIRKLTVTGQPFEGWAVSIIADIPPYGIVKDNMLSQYMIGELNGMVPARMGIIQLKKLS